MTHMNPDRFDAFITAYLAELYKGFMERHCERVHPAFHPNELGGGFGRKMDQDFAKMFDNGEIADTFPFDNELVQAACEKLGIACDLAAITDYLYFRPALGMPTRLVNGLVIRV